MEPYIQRHNPLITPRIEFVFAPSASRPLITSRIEFTPERLAWAKAERRRIDEPPILDHGGRGEGNSSACGGSNSDDQQPPSRNRKNKIPKPNGEPGRPGSGGYCLETILVRNHKWSKGVLGEINVSRRSNR